MKLVTKLFGALLLCAVATTAGSQTRVDVDEARKSITASHWQRNPDFLLRYTSPERYETGAWRKFRFGEVKGVAARGTGGKKEAGIYYENLFESDSSKKFLGMGFEFLEDRGVVRHSLEAHYILPLKKHSIFVGYENMSGLSTTTLGDFFSYKNLHLGNAVAIRSGESDEALYRKYTAGLLFAVENRYKGFFRFDNVNASYTGFLRFGKSEFQRTFTPNAFYIDNKIMAQQLFSRALNHNFDDSPLAFVCPSEMGRFVVVSRYNRRGNKNSEIIESYYTQPSRYPIIAGVSARRDDTELIENYSANVNIGTVIGPVRIVGNLGSQNSVYVSIKIK